MATIIELTDLSLPELQIYTKLTDVALRNRLDPEMGIFIAESPKVIDRALEAGYEPLSFMMERRHLTGQAAGYVERFGEDVPVYTGERELLAGITGYALTRGILCAMRRKPLPELSAVLNGAERIAVLENIVDATNIGAIFRSAAALGMDGVLITPSCCDPLCRRAIRVSMGTVFQVPWTMIGADAADWPGKGLQLLKEAGFRTAAMALTDRSVSIDDPALQKEQRLAIVLGTEGDGLSRETIAGCDYTARIPMMHGVDSLNVAAAGAVAFWELRKRPLK